jgi:hypothetical protein
MQQRRPTGIRPGFSVIHFTYLWLQQAQTCLHCQPAILIHSARFPLWLRRYSSAAGSPVHHKEADLSKTNRTGLPHGFAESHALMASGHALHALCYLLHGCHAWPCSDALILKTLLDIKQIVSEKAGECGVR